MSQFIPLNKLTTLVGQTRGDLAKLRSISTSVAGKVASLTNRREQLSDRYRTEETARLRSEASEQARAYLQGEGTAARLELIASQKGFWSVEAFLLRASFGTDQVSDTRALNIRLALPRMSTSDVGVLADMALSENQWTTLGLAFMEAKFRAADDLSGLYTRLLGLTIGAVTEAQALISEARQLGEFIGYTLKVISSGGSDLGVEMQSYIAINNDREEARLQAQLADEMAAERQAMQLRTGLR